MADLEKIAEELSNLTVLEQLNLIILQQFFLNQPFYFS